MTTDLTSNNLIDLLPENFKDDLQSICFSKAFDKIFEKAIESTNKIRFFNKVEDLDNTELDNLAKELHVDIYSENWTLAQKKEACKNSYLWHLKKGTVFVLKDFCKSIIGTADIQEWFDYGGLQYHYRAFVEFINNDVDVKNVKKVKEALNTYKNQRSLSDGFNINYVAQAKTRFLPILKTEVVKFSLPLIS